MAKKRRKRLTKKEKLIQTLVLSVIALILFLYQQSPWAKSSSSISVDTTLLSEQIKCVDGDTFWYQNEKIRLLAIDAPESTTRVDPFGKEASEYACDLLKQAETIRLEQDPGNEIDKYDRALYWVFLDDELLQLKLIEEGYAKIKYVDQKTVNQVYYKQMQNAQTQAEKEKKGLWSMP